MKTIMRGSRTLWGALLLLTASGLTVNGAAGGGAEPGGTDTTKPAASDTSKAPATDAPKAVEEAPARTGPPPTFIHTPPVKVNAIVITAVTNVFRAKVTKVDIANEEFAVQHEG